MSKAYLTIDDSPTKITPAFVDYVRAKGITPVMNFVGESVEGNLDEAIYAIRSGAIIGNHSYTPPRFSTLSPDECRREIARTETVIDRAYRLAGVTRTHRAFRFPYGDKGGANAPLLQAMLRDEFRFERLNDTAIAYPWWKENHLDTNVDMHWTIDFEEYRLPWNDGYTWDDIVKRVWDKAPALGGVPLDPNATHILLIHDAEATDAFLPRYYEKLLDYIIEQGVTFIEPDFLA